jgi:hypothetical protein
MRALAVVRRRLFFWQPAERPPEAEESLAALLARRDQVRARQAPVEPRPELFRPTTPVTETLPRAEEAPTSGPDVRTAAPGTRPAPAAPPEATTTSRLLEAKRRAQRRKD